CAGWISAVIIYFIFRSHAVLSGSSGILTSAVASFKVNSFLVFEYFEKIFLPYRLSPIPSREDAQIIVGTIVALAFIVVLVLRKKFTAMTFFGILWFFVFLFP